MFFDIHGLKQYIDETGIKQKVIAEKAGMSETTLCLILQGKRKCEVNECVNICNALNVKLEMFVKPRLPEHRKG